jgi:hypothetical protein
VISAEVSALLLGVTGSDGGGDNISILLFFFWRSSSSAVVVYGGINQKSILPYFLP